MKASVPKSNRSRPHPRPRAGFTLIEMLTVLLIIALLASIAFGAFQAARTTAWKQKARDAGRQLAIAWNLKMQDDGKFPSMAAFDTSAVGSDGSEITFDATGYNLTNSLNGARTYFEATTDQQHNGLRDHWGQLFHVRLDADYDGQVKDPANSAQYIHANVVVWSDGPPGRSNAQIVIW